MAACVLASIDPLAAAALTSPAVPRFMSALIFWSIARLSVAATLFASLLPPLLHAEMASTAPASKSLRMDSSLLIVSSGGEPPAGHNGRAPAWLPGHDRKLRPDRGAKQRT